MPITFCPLEVVWGDAATWASFVATAIAAWGVFRIANRDRADRAQSLREAERARAASLLPEFNHATAVLSAIYEYSRIRAEGGDPDLRFVAQMREGFMRLTLSDITPQAELSGLSSDMVGAVRLAATAVRRDQLYLAAFPVSTIEEQRVLADALPVRADACRNAIVQAADRLWQIVHGETESAPWVGQLGAG